MADKADCSSKLWVESGASQCQSHLVVVHSFWLCVCHRGVKRTLPDRDSNQGLSLIVGALYH